MTLTRKPDSPMPMIKTFIVILTPRVTAVELRVLAVRVHLFKFSYDQIEHPKKMGGISWWKCRVPFLFLGLGGCSTKSEF
jgi:hypothetical protein